jgi:hypothetical protein
MHFFGFTCIMQDIFCVLLSVCSEFFGVCSLLWAIFFCHQNEWYWYFIGGHGLLLAVIFLWLGGEMHFFGYSCIMQDICCVLLSVCSELFGVCSLLWAFVLPPKCMLLIFWWWTRLVVSSYFLVVGWWNAVFGLTFNIHDICCVLVSVCSKLFGVCSLL